MSAFLALVAEAETLGVTKLSWTCDVRGWTEDPRRIGRWTARATVPEPTSEPQVHTTYEGLGRTGEEALRVVVDFLKRVAT